MSFPRYPTYKESGVEWLGQVPAHWEVLPLKRRFNVTLGKMVTREGDEDDRETFPYLRSANVQAGHISLEDVKRMWLSPDERNALSLRAGDLVICEGGDVGRCAVLSRDLDGFGFQNSVLRVRPIHKSENRILGYWLNLLKEKGFIDVVCNKATIAHFTADKVNNLTVALAPEPEQRLIAEFLDRETGKIDALVEQQETLLKQLEEKRAATISHVVTKGLDLSVPMKDSGVEWLGQVPAHWDVFQARRLFRLIDDVTEDGTGELLTVSHLTGVSRRSEKSVSMFEAEDKEGYRQVVAGDLIINTMWAWMGAMGIAPEDGIVSPAYTVYRPKPDAFLPAYVAGLVRSRHLITEMTRYSKGIWSSRLRLYANEFFQLRLPRPPVEEQQRIAEFLEKHLSEAEALATEARKNIALLRERRSALISAAVTGRIDVRGTAKPATKVGKAA